MRISGFGRAEPQDKSCVDVFSRDFSAAVNNADVISLHLPDVPATRNFINAETLRMMKPSSILINTARGAVLDEDALYDAVKSGAIAEAGLDVFKNEPSSP